MLAGGLYSPADEELHAAHARALAWMGRYNASGTSTPDERRAILTELLARVGQGAVIRPPFFCDYGENISIGRDAFMNFGCVVLDCAAVTIGDGTQIGPQVQIYAVDHPRDPAHRRAMLELAKPVRIGANAWIGGGAIILPGVTVGNDAIVGAGSVVTRDVPPGVTVVGNPARPH